MVGERGWGTEKKEREKKRERGRGGRKEKEEMEGGIHLKISALLYTSEENEVISLR